MRLLVIERNRSLTDSQLCDDRSFVVCAGSPDEALLILRHETVDAVVLDVTAFSEAGFTFIRQLRTARNDTPLVALMGHQSADRVRALRLGADEAITQPVDSGELRARIAAVVRRNKGFSRSLTQVGDLSLSPETREVSYRNIPVHLTGREYSLLELLVLRRGRVVSKEMFLSYLYNGMDEPELSIVDVFMCKLRRRLNSVGADGMIGTVRGEGYTLRNVGGGATLPLTAIAGVNLQYRAIGGEMTTSRDTGP
jgi:two-component system cell cycle response regulator CtrA